MKCVVELDARVRVLGDIAKENGWYLPSAEMRGHC